MKIEGKVLGKKGTFCKNFSDLNGLLDFILTGRKVMLNEEHPIGVVSNTESFFIYSVVDEKGDVLFDAGEKRCSKKFRTFLKNVGYFLNHPELNV